MKTQRIDWRTLSMVAVLVVLWGLFRWQTGGYYFGGESIANLSRDMATWTILAAGMTLVIVAGHIDLSVGSLLALVAGSAALLMNREYGFGWPAAVALPVALAIGLGLGLLQGTLVACFRVPAFIVTLGGLFVFRGITQKVSAHDPRLPGDSWIAALGGGHVTPGIGWVLAAATVAAWTALVLRGRWRRRQLALDVEPRWLAVVKIAAPAVLILGFVHKVNQARGIPLQTLVMAAVLLVLYVVARHTRFGRHVFAVGGNPEAARLSGINVTFTTIAVFGIMGLLAALAAVVWMAQNLGATKNAGQWYELYAIAGCVIGGTSLMGGRGSIFGTLLGSLVMATVIQGMDYTDLENWLQLVVRGSVLVLAVGIDVATKTPPPWLRRLLARRAG